MHVTLATRALAHVCYETRRAIFSSGVSAPAPNKSNQMWRGGPYGITATVIWRGPDAASIVALLREMAAWHASSQRPGVIIVHGSDMYCVVATAWHEASYRY